MKAENRTFIISGGSSGLGLATVQLLLEQSAYVAVLDLAEPPESVANDHLKYFELDITKVEDVEQRVNDVAQWSAQTSAPLGGVISCAGVGVASKIIDHQGNLHSLDLWNFALAVNLTGTFNLARFALKHMIKVEPEGPDNERGVVVFAASAAAFEGQTGQVAYSATKGAIASMTLPLSRDLGRYGIRVVSIAPSAFSSAMTDRMPAKVRASLERDTVFPQRLGLAHEFAQTVKYILDCSYVNGTTIRIDAGVRMPYKL